MNGMLRYLGNVLGVANHGCCPLESEPSPVRVPRPPMDYTPDLSGSGGYFDHLLVIKIWFAQIRTKIALPLLRC